MKKILMIAVFCSSAWVVYSQANSAKPKLAPKPKLTAYEQELFKLGAIFGATIERQNPGKHTDGNKLADAAWQAWLTMEAPATAP